MNYNQLASHNPKIVCICHTMAADMQNKLHRRPTNYNAALAVRYYETQPRTKAPRPAPICAPRGGQRYKPRPKPRRHHLTHAAGMGQITPQRRHQYKAPCIVPLPGAVAATHDTPQTKATLPCINLRYATGWLYFLLWQDLKRDRMDEI